MPRLKRDQVSIAGSHGKGLWAVPTRGLRNKGWYQSRRPARLTVAGVVPDIRNFLARTDTFSCRSRPVPRSGPGAKNPARCGGAWRILSPRRRCLGQHLLITTVIFHPPLTHNVIQTLHNDTEQVVTERSFVQDKRPIQAGCGGTGRTLIRRRYELESSPPSHPLGTRSQVKAVGPFACDGT